MKVSLVFLFSRMLFTVIWYYSFVWFLKFFAGSPYFIVYDPVLWFLFLLGVYILEFPNNK